MKPPAFMAIFSKKGKHSINSKYSFDSIRIKLPPNKQAPRMVIVTSAFSVLFIFKHNA